MDGKTAAKGGEGRRMAAKAMVVAGVGILATAAMNLPPSAALRRLSPPDVHSEYVKFLSGKDTVTAYIAYPERPQPAPAVIVIHEIFGMSDFIRQTTEQLAKEGFVAIAPDLLSRRGGTPATPDSARKLIATLNDHTAPAAGLRGLSDSFGAKEPEAVARRPRGGGPVHAAPHSLAGER